MIFQAIIRPEWTCRSHLTLHRSCTDIIVRSRGLRYMNGSTIQYLFEDAHDTWFTTSSGVMKQTSFPGHSGAKLRTCFYED